MRKQSLPVLAIAREISEDRKLTTDPFVRFVSATHVTQHSCPAECALRGSGCYAEIGNQAFVTRRLNAAELLTDRPDLDAAHAEANAIDGLSGRWPLRLHVVGDCATPEAAQVVSAAVTRYQQKGEITTGSKPPVWTYTHAWRTVDRASWGSVSVLASCETAQDVADAHARGYPAAIVYSGDLPAIIDDHVTFQCPQQTGRRADCESCGLCAKSDKWQSRAVLGLKAHGATRKVAAAIAARQDAERIAANTASTRALRAALEGSN